MHALSECNREVPNSFRQSPLYFSFVPRLVMAERILVDLWEGMASLHYRILL